MTAAPADRLAAVLLDPATLGPVGGQVDHERGVAIYDLLELNSFAPVGATGGPWTLALAAPDHRLVMDVSAADGRHVLRHVLPLTTLRRMIRDYYLTCDSYYASIRSSTAAQIEALDRARRDQHDDGARHLQERIAGSIAVDFATARRLFTLIATLHWKG